MPLHNISLVVMCASILLLWVEVIQNMKLILIQICLQFVKVPKMEKNFPILYISNGPKPSLTPSQPSRPTPPLF
jgi:hypothetical protein